MSCLKGLLSGHCVAHPGHVARDSPSVPLLHCFLPSPAPKTVHVLAAVLVDTCGRWCRQKGVRGHFTFLGPAPAGKQMGEKGFFLEPTVFADAHDDMAIAKDEIFGPVMTALKWSSVNEVCNQS